MERRLERPRVASAAAAAEFVGIRSAACFVPPCPSLPDQYTTTEFFYYGNPLGKPRMTQRDKFRKRPCVLRYRAFADGLRAAAGELAPDPAAVLVTAFLAMPQSWSQRKQAEMNGAACRSRPDGDNIFKACADALFGEDSCIWISYVAKFWTLPGQECLRVKIFYVKP